MSDEFEDTFLAFRAMFPHREPDPTPRVEPEQSIVTRKKMTTVADLIAQLQQLPADMPVLTEDSESGYETRVEMRTEDVELQWLKYGTTLDPYVSYHSDYTDPLARPKTLPDGTELVKMLVIG